VNERRPPDIGRTGVGRFVEEVSGCKGVRSSAGNLWRHRSQPASRSMRMNEVAVGRMCAAAGPLPVGVSVQIK
jgi:hypothetical protein